MSWVRGERFTIAARALPLESERGIAPAAAANSAADKGSNELLRESGLPKREGGA